MKEVFPHFRILFILLLFCCSACQLLSDKNDDCEATKMDTTEEPTIYLRFYFEVPTEIMENHKPEKVVISGSIRKYYCSGKESGNYSYNPTFIVDDETFNGNAGVFIIPQLYQYKFENTKDKLTVVCRVKIFTKDGLIYESVEIAGDFYYKNIMFDQSELRHFIPIEPDPMEWVKVTS